MSTESPERQKIRADIAANHAEDDAIYARMDKHEAKQHAHNAAGRLLHEARDKLSAELAANRAIGRELSQQLRQTE